MSLILKLSTRVKSFYSVIFDHAQFITSTNKILFPVLDIRQYSKKSFFLEKYLLVIIKKTSYLILNKDLKQLAFFIVYLISIIQLKILSVTKLPWVKS
jgi:hypothetical protein